MGQGMASSSVDAEISKMTRDRYRGYLLGLAAGDALGTTLEFKPPGTFAPLARHDRP
jgi:ADP-ribosylglycohydrolase